MIKQFLNFIFLLSCTLPFYAADTKRKEVEQLANYSRFTTKEYDALLHGVGKYKDQVFWDRHICGGMYGSLASVKELVSELDGPSWTFAHWRDHNGAIELAITKNGEPIHGIQRGNLAYEICKEKGWEMES